MKIDSTNRQEFLARINDRRRIDVDLEAWKCRVVNISQTDIGIHQADTRGSFDKCVGMIFRTFASKCSSECEAVGSESVGQSTTRCVVANHDCDLVEKACLTTSCIPKEMRFVVAVVAWSKVDNARINQHPTSINSILGGSECRVVFEVVEFSSEVPNPQATWSGREIKQQRVTRRVVARDRVNTPGARTDSATLGSRSFNRDIVQIENVSANHARS